MSDHTLSPAQFLAHWQGHRQLTRQVIEAFPDDQLFAYHALDMRTFGELANEIHEITEYTVSGLLTDEWREPDPDDADSFGGLNDKAALLAAWDALTARLDREFLSVPSSRFAETRRLFWGEKTGLGWALYALDNEIHHRGQGYVYLRELGVKPPDFFARP
ncbi:Uncharacterized damage-inducible protein DinB (forms a four-helix bundle) [Deinococcus reticulitermitis]|uniref:Uncharacterized damage-inducible protein DinB (Forms a four-helix bundle) n=1 Tax=Deinococcus reticulitermitis TaxID=856736 RepID=A0A1H6UQB6_9DEIO|nr:Uncharacterized damage-inducible protein DinB (forms a four-helix bundle) [Deinococcus reticulitermitis]